MVPDEHGALRPTAIFDRHTDDEEGMLDNRRRNCRVIVGELSGGYARAQSLIASRLAGIAERIVNCRVSHINQRVVGGF